MPPSVDALVISDLHYVHEADHTCPIPRRRTALALDLCQRTFEVLGRRGVSPDIAIVLGDVVDNGEARGAERDLSAVAEVMRSWQIPILAVPGNHDGSGDRFARIFDCSPGLHTVSQVGFLAFHDRVGEGDVTDRPGSAVVLPKQIATLRPDLCLVALQHNPLHPPIESEYPYLLSNGGAVLDAYREAEIILSLSGHYHPGQSAHSVAGVTCYTVPALCEAPFRFAHVQMIGQTVHIQELALEKEE